MSRKDDIVDPQIEAALVNLKLSKMAGTANDPYHRFLTAMGLVPFDGGRTAARFIGLQRKMLLGKAISNLIAGSPPPKIPRVNAEKGIQMGFVRSIKQWFIYPVLALCQHLLVSGPVGKGKTNAIFFWLLQLLSKGLHCVFFDFKNEGRRLLNRLTNVAVLRIDQIRENLIQPVGNPKIYFTMFAYEFCKAYGIRPERRRRFQKLLSQMYSGLKPGQPCFGVADIMKCVKALAEGKKDSSWDTLLEALETLVETLGRNAYVRSGAKIQERCQVVVYEHPGMVSGFQEFFFAVMTHRMLAAAYEAGHTTAARTVIVLDEGRFALGRQMAGDTASGYVPAPVRLLSQSRSGGFIVIVGTQEIGGIQEVVPANAGGFVCVGAQTGAEQRIAGQRLQMAEDRWPVLGSTRLGEAWFVSHLKPSPIVLHIPECNMGSYPSDAVVAERMRDTMEWLDSHTLFAPADNEVSVPISYLKLIGEDDEESAAATGRVASILAEHIALLKAIIESSGRKLSTSELYRAAGVTPDKGGRLKRDLVENGLIRVEKVASRGRPREVIEATDEGRKLVNEIR